MSYVAIPFHILGLPFYMFCKIGDLLLFWRETIRMFLGGIEASEKEKEVVIQTELLPGEIATPDGRIFTDMGPQKGTADCHGNTFIRIVADYHIQQGMDPVVAEMRAYNDMPFIRKICYDYDIPYWPVTRTELMSVGVPYSQTCFSNIGASWSDDEEAPYLALVTPGHQQPFKRKFGYRFEFKDLPSDSEFLERVAELPRCMLK